jgi:hypothetical protein
MYPIYITFIPGASKKGSKQRRAFFLHNTSVYVRLMPEAFLKQVDYSAAGTRLSSLAPKYIRSILAFMTAPAHIGQGSSVTYRLQPPSLQFPKVGRPR